MEPAYKRFQTAHARLVATKGFYVLRVLRTFLIVNIGWYFDRSLRAADALRMMGAVATDLRLSQLTADTLLTLGATAADYGLLAVCTVLLFAVSVVQERGVVVSQWVSRRCLPVRWLVLLAGFLSVLVFGMYGSGFSEAAFIYYQF